MLILPLRSVCGKPEDYVHALVLRQRAAQTFVREPSQPVGPLQREKHVSAHQIEQLEEDVESRLRTWREPQAENPVAPTVSVNGAVMAGKDQIAAAMDSRHATPATIAKSDVSHERLVTQLPVAMAEMAWICTC